MTRYPRWVGVASMPLTRRSGWDGCAPLIVEPGRPGEHRLCDHNHRRSSDAQKCGIRMADALNRGEGVAS